MVTTASSNGRARRQRRRVVPLLWLGVLAGGCSLESAFTRSGTAAYPARPPNCKLEQYPFGSPPKRPFEILGHVVNRDGGWAVDCGRDQSLRLLLETACGAGGDALIDIRSTGQQSTCEVLEGTVVHWTAAAAPQR